MTKHSLVALIDVFYDPNCSDTVKDIVTKMTLMALMAIMVVMTIMAVITLVVASSI